MGTDTGSRNNILAAGKVHPILFSFIVVNNLRVINKEKKKQKKKFHQHQHHLFY